MKPVHPTAEIPNHLLQLSISFSERNTAKTNMSMSASKQTTSTTDLCQNKILRIQTRTSSFRKHIISHVISLLSRPTFCNKTLTNYILASPFRQHFLCRAKLWHIANVSRTLTLNIDYPGSEMDSHIIRFIRSIHIVISNHLTERAKFLFQNLYWQFRCWHQSDQLKA